MRKRRDCLAQSGRRSFLFSTTLLQPLLHVLFSPRGTRTALAPDRTNLLGHGHGHGARLRSSARWSPHMSGRSENNADNPSQHAMTGRARGIEA